MNCNTLGQQYDRETELYYNRHRYYDPQQGRYITQDPIGLRGGWNVYLYTNNPVRKIDPLGLSGWEALGHGGLGEYCQSIESAVRYLPPDQAEKVIRNAEKMHTVYNPLGEYVLGLAIGSAVTGMAGLGMGTVSVTEKGAACIEDVANSMIIDGEIEPKTLMLTCTKSFINKGSTSFQGKVSDYLIDLMSSYSQKE